jgi:hypothetical protein
MSTHVGSATILRHTPNVHYGEAQTLQAINVDEEEGNQFKFQNAQHA